MVATPSAVRSASVAATTKSGSSTPAISASVSWCDWSEALPTAWRSEVSHATEAMTVTMPTADAANAPQARAAEPPTARKRTHSARPAIAATACTASIGFDAAPRARPRLSRATAPNVKTAIQSISSGGRGGAVQRLLELGLGVLGQRRLQDGAAVLAEPFDRLVGGHLLDDDEQRRRARLEHVAHLLDELLVEPGLLDLAHERAEAGADGHAEDGHEEQQPEQQAPEHAPGGAAADGVMVRRDLVLAVGGADDRGDGIRLDDQVLREPLHLRLGQRRGGLVVVADGDEVGHVAVLLRSGVVAADRTSGLARAHHPMGMMPASLNHSRLPPCPEALARRASGRESNGSAARRAGTAGRSGAPARPG